MSIGRIVLGLCLTCFTLNFACLQYILPAIGTANLYLGFRALRKNNVWFQFGWICSICKVTLLYLSLVLNATPYADIFPVSRTVLQAAATLLLFAALRQALRQAAAELGQTSQKDPVLWALLWYLLIIFLALSAGAGVACGRCGDGRLCLHHPFPGSSRRRAGCLGLCRPDGSR